MVYWSMLLLMYHLAICCLCTGMTNIRENVVMALTFFR